LASPNLLKPKWEDHDHAIETANTITRQYKGETYVGTCYTPPEVTLNNGEEVGTRFVFWGLNSKVLKLIRESLWEELVEYWDENAENKSDRRSNYTVTSDGVIKYGTSKPSKADRKALEQSPKR
jgi:hypothetical protein